jgi:limonene-1,2-epoxide hydrolase
MHAAGEGHLNAMEISNHVCNSEIFYGAIPLNIPVIHFAGEGKPDLRNPTLLSFPHIKMNPAMNPGTPVEVVSAYLDAFEDRDFERARHYLSDTDFHYHSPVSDTSNADAFTINISRLGPILERIQRRKVFTQGNEVCVIMHLITTMEHLKDVPVVQLATVIDGKITDMEVFFDASEYNRMFDVDP